MSKLGGTGFNPKKARTVAYYPGEAKMDSRVENDKETPQPCHGGDGRHFSCATAYTEETCGVRYESKVFPSQLPESS